MTAASYTTDLTAQTLTTAEATTGWAEATATGWTGLDSPTNQTESFIQGNASVGSAHKATGLGAELYNNGSGVTVPTDGAVLFWGTFASAGALETQANGGLRCVIGNALNAFYGWAVGGSDNPEYGGWKNYAIDPNISGIRDYTAGSPTGTWQYFGFGINALTKISKGEPYAADVIRYGRCEARINGGTSPDAAAAFAGFAAQNDNNANRWGLIQSVDGGYLWKGLMVLGYTSAVRFTDANTLVLVDNTIKVSSNFNKVEIRQATSEVNLTNVSFLALGTVSRGNWEVVDNADVNLDGCTFTGMGTFIWKAACDVLNSVFRNCQQITANGANFAGTSFSRYEGATDTSYLIWDVATDPINALADCTFTKGVAATHAIEFGTTSPTTINLPNTLTFSGYNASNGQTDSTVYIARDSGSVSIFYDGANFSYKSAGATVTIFQSQVTLTIAAQVSLAGAEVRIYDLDGTPPHFGTELAGQESNPSATFAFTGAAANVIWIQIFKAGHEEFGIQTTMPAANSTLNVVLVQDLNA